MKRMGALCLALLLQVSFAQTVEKDETKAEENYAVDRPTCSKLVSCPEGQQCFKSGVGDGCFCDNDSENLPCDH